MSLTLKPHQNHLLMELAKLSWWVSPLEAIKKPENVIVLTMTKGSVVDIHRLIKFFDADLLFEVLQKQGADEMELETWRLWHVLLKRTPLKEIPAMPAKGFFASALSSFSGDSLKFDPHITTATMFAPAGLSERLLQITRRAAEPLYRDIAKHLKAGDDLAQAIGQANEAAGEDNTLAILKALCKAPECGIQTSEMTLIDEALCSALNRLFDKNA